MGDVYRATDTRLQWTVALKVLLEESSIRGDFRGRFEREARPVAALRHPHICLLRDIGQDAGVDFLVMEPGHRAQRLEAWQHHADGIKRQAARFRQG